MKSQLQMEGKRKATDDSGGHGACGNGNCTGRLSMRGRVRSFPPPFLMKTYEMVQDPETNSIISWSPNNTSFTVWDQIKFTSEILPKHFRHSNFSSFVYQLNNYGFKKVSWEKFEYENPWFQPGKKHLLKNMRRRNQPAEFDIMLQQDPHGSSDDLLKDGMEEQVETLMTEQHSLKVEVQKLNEQQKEMDDQFNAFKERMKVAQRTKEEMVSQLLVHQFIKNLREKREKGINETIKKQKLDASRSNETSGEIIYEGDCSRLDKKDEIQEEVTIIQPEGQTFSSPDDSGSSNAIKASELVENCAFWKKILEDGSEHQNGGEEEGDHHLKVIVKLEDLIASNNFMEGDQKPLDRNLEEGDDLKLCT